MESCRSLSALIRSISVSGKAGWRTTSATSRTKLGQNSESTSPERFVVSGPTPMSSEPPMRAAASDTCTAVMVLVPSASMSPVTSASHTWEAASSAFPTRTDSSTRTFGTVP